MYIVVGNHGIGKTAFMSRLVDQASDISIAQDPHEDAYDISEAYEWTLERELIRLKRHGEQDLTTEAAPVLTQHSMYIQRYVFAYNAYMNGKIGDIEWDVYHHTYNEMSRRHSLPSGIIYLYTEPDIIGDYSPNNDRTVDIPLNDRKQIHNRYEDIFVRKSKDAEQLHRVPTIIVDYNLVIQGGDTDEMHKAIYEADRFIVATERCRADQSVKVSTA
jgi:deoxyadenosine/deoxycytidine kinase